MVDLVSTISNYRRYNAYSIKLLWVTGVRCQSNLQGNLIAKIYSIIYIEVGWQKCNSQ